MRSHGAVILARPSLLRSVLAPHCECGGMFGSPAHSGSVSSGCAKKCVATRASASLMSNYVPNNLH